MKKLSRKQIGIALRFAVIFLLLLCFLFLFLPALVYQISSTAQSFSSCYSFIFGIPIKSPSLSLKSGNPVLLFAFVFLILSFLLFLIGTPFSFHHRKTSTLLFSLGMLFLLTAAILFTFSTNSLIRQYYISRGIQNPSLSANSKKLFSLGSGIISAAITLYLCFFLSLLSFFIDDTVLYLRAELSGRF